MYSYAALVDAVNRVPARQAGRLGAATMSPQLGLGVAAGFMVS
jgi:hypothetical protein